MSTVVYSISEFKPEIWMVACMISELWTEILATQEQNVENNKSD